MESLLYNKSQVKGKSRLKGSRVFYKNIYKQQPKAPVEAFHQLSSQTLLWTSEVK